MKVAAAVGVGSLVSAGGSLLSSGIQSGAATNAANQANQTLGGYLGQINQNEAGYNSAGNTAVSTLSNDEQNGTGFASPFTMSDFYNNPGYQFTLQQGQNAVNNSAAAKGGLLSGAAAKGIASYTTGLANQTYNSAFQNYLSNRQEGYNELAGTASIGQQGISSANSAAASLGSGMAQNTQAGIMGAGNATAAGVAGAANSVGGGLSSLGQYYGLQSVLGGSGGGYGVNYNHTQALNAASQF